MAIFSSIIAALLSILSRLVGNGVNSPDDIDMNPAEGLADMIWSEMASMGVDPFTHEWVPFDPLAEPEACQRDYTVTCPADFYLMPKTDDSDVRVCAPSYKYKGACMAGDFPYSTMSAGDKKRWAKRCRRNWPCIQCQRDYSQSCPNGWTEFTPKGSTVSGCIQPGDYDGPCKIPTMGVSFEHFNIEMLEAWSDTCKAWWPCSNGDGMPKFASPLSLEATAWRISKGLQ